MDKQVLLISIAFLGIACVYLTYKIYINRKKHEQEILKYQKMIDNIGSSNSTKNTMDDIINDNTDVVEQGNNENLVQDQENFENNSLDNITQNQDNTYNILKSQYDNYSNIDNDDTYDTHSEDILNTEIETNLKDQINNLDSEEKVFSENLDITENNENIDNITENVNTITEINENIDNINNIDSIIENNESIDNITGNNENKIHTSENELEIHDITLTDTNIVDNTDDIKEIKLNKFNIDIPELNLDNLDNDKNNDVKNIDISFKSKREEYIRKYTLKELQKIAKENNIKVKGKKEELIDRFFENKIFN